jgi:hypothetical protein
MSSTTRTPRSRAPEAGRRVRRGMLGGLTAVVVALGLLGVGVAGASAAGASAAAAAGRGGHCTQTVTGTHHGVLVAGSGVLCLDRATQFGPVRVWPRAGLQVSASVITGAVTATRARSVQICGSTIIGPLRASAAAGPVTVGGTGASCRGDIGHGLLVISGPVRVTGLRQQGPVTLSGNAGGLTLSGGSVGGTVTVRGNRGGAPVVVSANALSGSLACAANRPAPGDRHRPNTVSGTASGQCAGLVPPRPRRQAGAPLAQDLSGTLPNLNYGQAVGDFTGAGHDQLAYAQNGQLNIANVDKFGGAVVSQVPTDLMATPNDGFTQGVGRDERRMTVWWADCCHYDQYAATGSTYGLTSVKTAASASDIYMAGATWNAGDPLDTYQLHLYKLPHDGSCASAACAEETVKLPSEFEPPSGRVIVATSLAVGVVGGRTLIAVGLSDDGIYIFNDALQLVTTITDMAGADAQTPVTALAFGPPTGSGQGGVLVGGVESPVASLFTWQLNPDGTEGFHSVAGLGWFPQVVMGAAVARVNGQTVSVFTRSDGDVLVVNPDSGALIADLPGGLQTGQPTGLTPLTPWNGEPGNQELVVGKLGGTGDEVLQYSVVTGALTEVPIGSQGATAGTADQVYAWFPGYQAGRLRVANNSAGPVDIAMASRQDPGYGCWLDAPVTQPPVPAFPVGDTSLAAGAVSADFFAAALTAGPTGNCASAQPGSTGERAAYVIITPAGDSADEHVVKLLAGADGTLSIPDQPGQPAQVGGYLTASLSQVSPGPGSLGTWQLTVTGGSAPAASAAPSVAGYRLTAAPDPANYTPPSGPAADDPCRPVYRFDVTGAQWNNVTSAGQVAAQLPPMTAQGSADGGQTWQNLGQLMPSAAPAVTADGAVTLGPASFFFQNAAGTATAPGVWTSDQPSACPATGQAPVTEVRVVSGGQASSPVTLAAPKAPPLNGGTGATPVQGVAAVPDGNGGAAAVLRADGVDQAGLTLQLTPSGGGSVPATDPRYNLVYYRDDVTKALVTGLYQPGDYAGYTGIGPYAADGSTIQPTRNYLATTSTAPGHLDPVMNDTGTVSAYAGSSFAVAGSSNPLSPTAGATITGGIGITGCATTAACTLAVPDGPGPALYQAGGPQPGGADLGPLTGLLLSATAITSPACLPLQTGTANAHNLGSAPLTVSASQAKLAGAGASQFWPSDSVDTALVTAGQLVPVLSIPVGGGG